MDRPVQTSQESCRLHFGVQAILQSDNARDLSLRDICGTDALNYLFEGAARVFYEDTLCVDPQCRRRHIAQKALRSSAAATGINESYSDSTLPLRAHAEKDKADKE